MDSAVFHFPLSPFVNALRGIDFFNGKNWMSLAYGLLE